MPQTRGDTCEMSNAREVLFRLRLGEIIEIDFAIQDLITEGLHVNEIVFSTQLDDLEQSEVRGRVINEEVNFIWKGRKFNKGSMISVL